VVDAKRGLGPDEGLVPDLIDPKAWLQAGGGEPPINPEAILPPSEAVRLEMRKMELEAEIQNAGGAVMSASGDMVRGVGMPSREALEAFEAGELDATGPAGETDFAERARLLEQEEKG
jgi:hypothetical protein